VGKLLKNSLLLAAVVTLSSCSSLSLEREALRAISDANPTRQAVVVVPTGKTIFHAAISAWKKTAKGWQRVMGPWPAVVGRNGFAPSGEKREGDGRTPSGIFPVEMSFGRAKAIGTHIPYRQATADDVWVDDVKSTQYNQWVHGAPQATSFETMLRPDGLYDLGVVIGYNTRPVVPGQGSAIFIHIWRDEGKKPTAGCVALSRARVSKLLVWLDASKAPVVVLGK
jgi:L,D-peptidoglycan transpeptidase YkuD (ErfK/YbiS/YcfS/YnhG family)